MITIIGLFFIRLDGAPAYTMYCSVIPAGLNVVLDYLFIFPFGWGLAGAAMASGFTVAASCLMVLTYLFFRSTTLHFQKPAATRESVVHTFRDIRSMLKLGGSTMFSELAISLMIMAGNYLFMRLLGEDCVAAFSVACYCLPVLFMVDSAIAQSAQPIISFTHGAGDRKRVARVAALSIKSALVLGLAFCYSCFSLRMP